MTYDIDPREFVRAHNIYQAVAAHEASLDAADLVDPHMLSVFAALIIVVQSKAGDNTFGSVLEDVRNIAEELLTREEQSRASEGGDNQ